MERKIGEIFEYNGWWYQCVVAIDGCRECSFRAQDYCTRHSECFSDTRSDGISVIFKKLEKVGEPYSCNYYGDNRLIMMQEYNLFNLDDVTNEDKIPMYITDYKHKRIAIEIKQTKEDMEENHKAEDTLLTRLVGRYVNNLIDYETFEKAVKELYSDKKDSKPTLKEFDLEAAKVGKPVYKRDGRKARIICFNMNSFNNHVIVALITEENGTESIYSYTSEGKWKETETENDLMMLPEKKEGWVNVYKERCYESKEEAISCRACNMECIDTIRMEWEE